MSELPRKLQAQHLVRAHVLHAQAPHARNELQLKHRQQQRLNAEIEAACLVKRSSSMTIKNKKYNETQQFE